MTPCLAWPMPNPSGQLWNTSCLTIIISSRRCLTLVPQGALTLPPPQTPPLLPPSPPLTSQQRLSQRISGSNNIFVFLYRAVRFSIQRFYSEKRIWMKTAPQLTQHRVASGWKSKETVCVFVRVWQSREWVMCLRILVSTLVAWHRIQWWSLDACPTKRGCGTESCCVLSTSKKWLKTFPGSF